MVANRRRGEEAVPSNYKKLLTSEQIDGLRKLESFGWGLTYVRRPKFEPVEVIIKHSDGKSHAALLPDGTLDQVTPVRVRGDGAVAPDVSDALSVVDNEPFMAKPTAKTSDESSSSAQKEPLPPATDKTPNKFLV